MDEKIVQVEEAFQLAIQEAKKGSAFVSPNPLVGCVIVDEKQQLIATGYHAKYGEPHAEADALQKLQPDQLKNATVYVTLEPCAHEGKTPSCAKALAKLPIKKVIYGLQDPNPLVSGQGAKVLQEAGIEALEYKGALKNDLEDLCEIFLKNFRQKKIFIAAKVATSLDGQIALKSGESKWITGPDSRLEVHALRANYDAILVGSRTIEIDDPSLNIRHPEIQKTAKLIILDGSSKLLSQISNGKDFRFLKTHQKENIFFAVKKADKEFLHQQIAFESLNELNQKIWDLGLRSIFIEGGSETYSSYLQENLIDRLHVFMAPSIIGSVAGLSWTSSLQISSLSEKLVLRRVKSRTYGEDLYITGRFQV